MVKDENDKVETFYMNFRSRYKMSYTQFGVREDISVVNDQSFFLNHLRMFRIMPVAV